MTKKKSVTPVVKKSHSKKSHSKKSHSKKSHKKTKK